MTEKIVLIGAGSVMFTKTIISDLLRRNLDVELVLVDINEDALNTAAKLAQKMIAMKGASIRLRTTTDRCEVLPGATIVLSTIDPGGRAARNADFEVCRKFGIYHSVGGTFMPAGAFSALRIIPPVIAIARDVVKYAPDALFFNFSNPTMPICHAVRKTTGANIVGLCTGVRLVGGIIAEQLGAKPNELTYTAVGINHLTWFTELWINGKDAMPQLKKVTKQKLKELETTLNTDVFRSKTEIPNNANPWTWQLVDLVGAFPAVLDRHIIEFFPTLFAREQAYYGFSQGMDVFNYSAENAYWNKIREKTRNDAYSEKPLDNDYFPDHDHEEVFQIVEDIRSGRSNIYSVNLPNEGQVPNLPHGGIIESPAVTTPKGFRPIHLPPLAPALVATICGKFPWTELIVDAALEGSRDKVIQAILFEGSVPSLAVARELVDQLIETNTKYLPKFKCGNVDKTSTIDLHIKQSKAEPVAAII